IRWLARTSCGLRDAIAAEFAVFAVITPASYWLLRGRGIFAEVQFDICISLRQMLSHKFQNRDRVSATDIDDAIAFGMAKQFCQSICNFVNGKIVPDLLPT